MSATASLLLDVGGQGVLALVLDEQARPCFETHREIASSENGERVEQDPDELVDTVQTLIDDACSALKARAAPVINQAALAVQRGSIVCWERASGAALSPVLSWRDRRSLPQLQALSEQAEIIRQRTGLRYSPYAGAPKLAWCLSELPQVRKAAIEGRLACGPLGSFLLARLLDGGPCRVDPTLAQRSLLWSRQTLDWDPGLLHSFGLTPDILPRLVPSRSRHGQLRGMASDLNLELLLGDQNGLPYIDGRPDTDTVYINLGTGAFLLRPLPEWIDDGRFQGTLLDAAEGGSWALEASVHGAASALNWLKHEHGVDIPPERWSEIRRSVDTPPLFLNRIDGLGSPWWQASSDAAFHDSEENSKHSPEALLLAVLESIAFLIRANIETMSETLKPANRIVVCGGLSRSDTLCELIAAALGCDLQRLKAVEGTALGLWCRLREQALSRDLFETIPCQADPALDQRFRQWSRLIASDLGARPAT